MGHKRYPAGKANHTLRSKNTEHFPASFMFFKKSPPLQRALAGREGALRSASSALPTLASSCERIPDTLESVPVTLSWRNNALRLSFLLLGVLTWNSCAIPGRRWHIPGPSSAFSGGPLSAWCCFLRAGDPSGRDLDLDKLSFETS